MPSFLSVGNKDGLAVRAIFVLLVVSRGGHVIWGVKIQRWSCPLTCLCMLSGDTWRTRDVRLYCNTKTVFSKTCLCILNGIMWQARGCYFLLLWRALAIGSSKLAHNYSQLRALGSYREHSLQQRGPPLLLLPFAVAADKGKVRCCFFFICIAYIHSFIWGICFVVVSGC